MFDPSLRDYADLRRRQASLPNLQARYREELEAARALDRLEARAALERARLGLAGQTAILQP